MDLNGWVDGCYHLHVIYNQVNFKTNSVGLHIILVPITETPKQWYAAETWIDWTLNLSCLCTVLVVINIESMQWQVRKIYCLSCQFISVTDVMNSYTSKQAFQG